MVDSRECIARARELAPLLAEHAAEAERLRRPVDAVIDAVADAELFKLMVPRRYGGLELDLDTFTEVGLALAEGDASMAWVSLFYIEHNWMLCQFPESFQQKLYADRSFVLAPAMIAASGTAVPHESGYRLDGRWSWATGITHGEWVLVGAVMQVEGSFDVRFFALERAQVEVEDVWFMDGMAGTGSNDVIVRDCFVPEERTVSIMEMSAGTAYGARVHEAPLYRTPMIGILAPTAAIPAVGQALAVVRHFGGDLVTRTLPMGGTLQSDRAAQQARYGRVELEAWDAATVLRSGVQSVMERRDQATIGERIRHRAVFGLAVERARSAIQSACEGAGSSAHRLDHPLQRARRDVETIGSHVVFDFDMSLELHGRVLLGQAPGPGLF